MASILKVDSIGKTSGSTQDTMGGLIKQWMHFDAESTLTVDDSFNVSTVVDDAAGQYSPNFSNNMNNATYSMSSSTNSGLNGGGGNNDGGIMTMLRTGTMTTSTYPTQMCDINNAVDVVDRDRIAIQICGDLA